MPTVIISHNYCNQIVLPVIDRIETLWPEPTWNAVTWANSSSCSAETGGSLNIKIKCSLERKKSFKIPARGQKSSQLPQSTLRPKNLPFLAVPKVCWFSKHIFQSAFWSQIYLWNMVYNYLQKVSVPFFVLVKLLEEWCCVWSHSP